MVKFNPIIKEKLKESKIAEPIKIFLDRALLLELESSSTGIRYHYGRQLDEYIKEGAWKFSGVKDET